MNPGRFTSSGGLWLCIARVDKDTVLDVTGDETLTENRSVVTNLEAFAVNELGYRRARDAKRKKGFRKRANTHRHVVLGLVDLLDDVGGRTRDGYCSACLTLSRHHRVERRTLAPVAYVCSDCGAATTPCAVPTCKHFAVRSPRQLDIARFCAEHAHEIPAFDKLDARLGSLQGYAAWLDYDKRNAKRLTVIAGGLIIGCAVVCPAAYLAAPAIGGAIGAFGTELSGAAATSHGLALLGGGSIASGGGGMAVGTLVVAGAGTSLGGAAGASVTAAYVADDPSFAIELVADGTGGPVVFSSGFLKEDEHGWGQWKPLIRARYPDRPVYRLRWGAKEMKHLLALVGGDAGTKGALALTARIASRATSKAAGQLAIIGGVLTAAEIAKNPWWVAQTKATMTGAVLADLISRTDVDGYVLVGHSLGARVMFEATRVLAAGTGPPHLESVHLLGAAVPSRTDLHGIDRAVSGTVWNYWSNNDSVLSRLYRSAQAGQHAAGAVGFADSTPKVKNHNVSRLVRSHSDYTATIRLE